MSRHHATTMLVAGAALAGAAAGCSGQPALTEGSVTSCFRFAGSAIERHVTVTAVPPACQGLSQIEVNAAVDRALRAAVAGVRGKVGQRELIARDSRYLAALIHSVPPSSPPAVTARPSPPPSRAALSLAALIAWLVTVGLGLSMLARWVTWPRRHTAPSRGRGPVLNFTHLGLALTGLLAWIGYLATRVTGLAWAACGLLLAAASLGMALVFLSPAGAAAGTQPGHDPPSVGRIALAVNVALATGRPLLVRGKPGVGKSSLAADVAAKLGWRYYEETVTSRTRARDLLWSFDAIRRLNDANIHELKDPLAYVTPGVLWWAFSASSAAARGLSPMPLRTEGWSCGPTRRRGPGGSAAGRDRQG